MDFYQGKVLRLDLSAGASTVEPLNMEWAERYIGGKGLLLRYMWDEVPRHVDPWAPENPVILMTGPFAGTNVSTASRLVVGCKSPQTGILNDSYVGGSFAPELKFAGYDVVIITGESPEPVVVVIKDDVVSLRAGEAQVLGPQHRRDRAGHARRRRPERQDAVHRSCRREPAPLGLPLHRPVPQGREGRSRRPLGPQEPQGHRRARHRHRHRRRRQGVPGRHVPHPQRVRAHRGQPLGQRRRHADPRADHERRRRDADAQLVVGHLRRRREHQLGRVPQDPHQEPRLLPVRHRLPPVPRGRRHRRRGSRVRDHRPLRRQLRHRRHRRAHEVQRAVRPAGHGHHLHRQRRRPGHGPHGEGHQGLRHALRRDRGLPQGARAHQRQGGHRRRARARLPRPRRRSTACPSWPWRSRTWSCRATTRAARSA